MHQTVVIMSDSYIPIVLLSRNVRTFVLYIRKENADFRKTKLYDSDMSYTKYCYIRFHCYKIPLGVELQYENKLDGMSLIMSTL